MADIPKTDSDPSPTPAPAPAPIDYTKFDVIFLIFSFSFHILHLIRFINFFLISLQHFKFSFNIINVGIK